MEYTTTSLPDSPHILSLPKFKKDCIDGWLIDYDGYAKYVTDDWQMTDISIRHSEAVKGKFDKRFKKVVWFNR